MYQILKDFAGPIATAVAALAAVWVTAYFARHQKKIAEEQAHIAREKLRHDLYDRRYRVFDAARTLLVQIARERISSDEALRAFVIGTGDAVFLFDDDMAAQLKQMYSHAQKLQILGQYLEPMPVGPQRTKLVNQSEEEFKWLDEQLGGLVDTFKPFLKSKLEK
ncbi:MAG: hypothetical protein L0Y57_01200 [Beijerinckiaceae bacterium]|nr:hypothetical protein [Beijerinckiaceae bacterium]